LRGYFACPVIAILGELGVADRMLAGRFSLEDFAMAPESDVLAALFQYLQSIGLMREVENCSYELTPDGRTVITRNGAFSLLMSYADYFSELPALLTGKAASPTVDRLRNVRGSGQLHSGKFFASALKCFDGQPPTALIDIGCGDGCFLAQACEKWPGLISFGVDLSESAVEATTRRLGASGITKFTATAANGFDIELWSRQVPEAVRSSPRPVISMWFVGHEFSQGKPKRIVAFFAELHRYFPRAEVMLGEINKISPRDFAQDYELSIMPEFLLFHELSHQGVLSWQDWQKILTEIPYELMQERRFDEVRSLSGVPIPASFVWQLRPERSGGMRNGQTESTGSGDGFGH
jgi:hypothetical protein